MTRREADIFRRDAFGYVIHPTKKERTVRLQMYRRCAGFTEEEMERLEKEYHTLVRPLCYSFSHFPDGYFENQLSGDNDVFSLSLDDDDVKKRKKTSALQTAFQPKKPSHQKSEADSILPRNFAELKANKLSKSNSSSFSSKARNKTINTPDPDIEDVLDSTSSLNEFMDAIEAIAYIDELDLSTSDEFDGDSTLTYEYGCESTLTHSGSLDHSSVANCRSESLPSSNQHSKIGLMAKSFTLSSQAEITNTTTTDYVSASCTFSKSPSTPKLQRCQNTTDLTDDGDHNMLYNTTWPQITDTTDSSQEENVWLEHATDDEFCLTTDLLVSRSCSSPCPSLDSVLLQSAHEAAAVAAGICTTTNTEEIPRLTVAIDLGTTGCAYAYSFSPRAEKVRRMRRLEPSDPSLEGRHKLPANLLLDSHRCFQAFGAQATAIYYDLSRRESKNWLYFNNFLADAHSTVGPRIDSVVLAANGVAMPLTVILRFTLMFLWKRASQELRAVTPGDQTLENTDVHWTLLHPPLWDQSAIEMLRKAGEEAGLPKDKLTLLSEPIAASLFCRHMPADQVLYSWRPSIGANHSEDSLSRKKKHPSGLKVSENSLEFQTRYMVADLGGASVDVSVHEEDTTGKSSLMYKTTGGSFGAKGVDMAFMSLLNQLIGQDVVQSYQTKFSQGYYELTSAFQTSRRKVSNAPDSPKNYIIPLPFTFIMHCKKVKSYVLEKLAHQNDDIGLQWSSQGVLRLSSRQMIGLFKDTLDSINKVIQDVLQDCSGVQTIYLIGGFSETPLLRENLVQAFGNQVQIIIPIEPQLAALKGGVLHRWCLTDICNRRSPYTYGVAILRRFNPKIHPEEKHVMRDGSDWCVDIFDVFVRAQQELGCGYTVMRRYSSTRPGQMTQQLNLYRTKATEVNFTTDPGVEMCGYLHFDYTHLSLREPRKRRFIQARITFTGENIMVSAIDMATKKPVIAMIKSDLNFNNDFESVLI